MWRYLGFVEIAMLVYCLVDCIQAEEGRIRNLPKIAWILLIIILPLAGGVAWLAVGRLTGTPHSTPAAIAAIAAVVVIVAATALFRITRRKVRAA